MVSSVDAIVVAVAVLAIAGLAWYFFAPAAPAPLR